MTVRFVWNALPPSGLDAKRLPLPVACVATPLAEPPALLLRSEPLLCRGGCHSVCGRHCSCVSDDGSAWICAFCGASNALPPGASDAARSGTVDYALQRGDTALSSSSSSAAFVFAIDASAPAAELSALKDAVEDAVGLLPPSARVGVVAFAADVRVFALRASDGGAAASSSSSDAAADEAPTAFVFDGAHDVSPAKVARLLEPLQSRLIAPLDECEFRVASVLEGIESQADTAELQRRPATATGAAVAVVCGLLEAACKGSGARALFFCANPCTRGPGTVVGPLVADRMRSHAEIDARSAPFLAAARQHYDTLAARFAENGHAADVFGCSLDQVGLHEMQTLARRTGGTIVLGDSFAGSTFRDSLVRLLECDEGGEIHMGFNATVEVVVSGELRVCGVVGNVTPIFSQDRKALVSDTEIGVGGTTAWRLCCIDRQTSLTFFFDVVHPHALPTRSQEAVVQILTHYHTFDGKQMLRVTTVARPWADGGGGGGGLLFDETAAAVVLARQTVLKRVKENPIDVLRSVDRTLIKTVGKLGSYKKGDPSSLVLSEQLNRFAQIVYNFRRSEFLQTFNSSPDETAVANFHLLCEPADLALRMINPLLLRYTLEGSCDSVPLAASSISDNVILMLDAFSSVVVLVGHELALLQKSATTAASSGATVVADSEDDSSAPDSQRRHQLTALLSKVVADAEAIVQKRFPRPRYIECGQYSGNARFLLSLLDPETDLAATASASDIATLVPSEDVSFYTFLLHLSRFAVNT